MHTNLLKLGIAVLLLCSAGCDRRSPQTPARASTDWTVVTAVQSPIASAGIKTLARKLDLWSGGSVPSVTFSYSEGAFRDDLGHSLDTTPEMWKGMIQLIRQERSGYLDDFAMGSIMYDHGLGRAWGDDKEGKKPRFMYRFTVLSEDAIGVSIQQKYDEGD